MIIKGNNLTLVAGKKTIFSNLSFSMGPTGLTLVYGNNGGGKTSFLAMVALYLSATEGELFFDEDDVSLMSNKEKEILRSKTTLYIPPSGTFLSFLSIEDNISCIDNLSNYRTNLSFGSKMPNEVSGGEYQEGVLELIKQNQKPIILIDEGTAYLDKTNIDTYLKEIKVISKRKIVIMASPRKLDVQAESVISL
jgi:putative ABC transport system ATP-binding protein